MGFRHVQTRVGRHGSGSRRVSRRQKALRLCDRGLCHLTRSMRRTSGHRQHPGVASTSRIERGKGDIRGRSGRSDIGRIGLATSGGARHAAWRLVPQLRDSARRAVVSRLWAIWRRLSSLDRSPLRRSFGGAATPGRQAVAHPSGSNAPTGRADPRLSRRPSRATDTAA